MFTTEAVKDFIQGRSSYAVIKQRKHIAVGTISSWVHTVGNACMSPVEIAHTLSLHVENRWSGILLLDGKYLNKRSVLLLAIDYTTTDIVAHLIVDSETEESYTALVDLVEKTGYTIRAIVSDGQPAIIALTQPKKPPFIRKGTRSYPRPGVAPAKVKLPRLFNIPHQWCVVHAERELTRYLAKVASFNKLDEQTYQYLLALTRNVLFAKTLRRAEKYYHLLLLEVGTRSMVYQQIPRIIHARWHLFTAHHTVRIGRRKIPRSSNSVENVIAYINARLKTMRKLRTAKSAEPICSLIVVNYRTKPLINTKNKLKRGKSPLALASGKNTNFDWKIFIKKSTA